MYKFRVTILNINKELVVALKSIWGLGWYKVNFVLNKIGFSFPFFINNLNFYFKELLFYYLDYALDSMARNKRLIALNIKKLIDLKTYRGIRHDRCLPVHGQRTRTNANTQRSKRRIKNLNKLLKYEKTSKNK